MSREKGHALRRDLAEPPYHTSSWSCECGVTFGKRSVHAARKVWREHKDALAAS